MFFNPFFPLRTPWPHNAMIVGLILSWSQWLKADPAELSGPAITNLQSLHGAVAEGRWARGAVALEATVCAAEPLANTLVLQDETGTAVVELDRLDEVCRPGDRIRLVATNRRIIRRSGSIALTAVPLVDLRNTRGLRKQHVTLQLKPGLYPVQLFCFNVLSPEEFGVSYWGPNFPLQSLPAAKLFHRSGADGATNLLPGLEYFCFNAPSTTLHDVLKLEPIASGTIPSFDLRALPTQGYISVRFRGLLAISEPGNYQFTLRADDSGELYLDDKLPQIVRIGSSAPILKNDTALRNFSWCTVRGVVKSIARGVEGPEWVLDTGAETLQVRLVSPAAFPEPFQSGARVQLTGVFQHFQSGPEAKAIGQITVVGSENIHVMDLPPGAWKSVLVSPGSNPPALTTALQVHALSSEEANQRRPVDIQGVVTCLVQWKRGKGAVVQDSTHGVFVYLSESNFCQLAAGDCVAIQGVTDSGKFAPTLRAQSLHRLGTGPMPSPVQPGWNQLINGSLDCQYVELSGVVIGVTTNTLCLLTDNGKLMVQVPDWGEAALTRLENSNIRIRGCLLAEFDASTHLARIGWIKMFHPVIETVQSAPADPFATSGQSIADLFRFKLQLNSVQRIKTAGQIVGEHDGEFFLFQDGFGLRFQPIKGEKLAVGDRVEVVGFPDMNGPSPQLHEAVARRTGSAPLPPPLRWSQSNPPSGSQSYDGLRVKMEGRLIDLHQTGRRWILELQVGAHPLSALVEAEADLSVPFPLNSQIELIGIYSLPAGEIGAHPKMATLLVASASDIRLIERPPWWTWRRWLLALGLLTGILMGALLWIYQLRRLVRERTRLLEVEHRGREQAERERAVEMERSRIARDLHDDLGSSLTEIRVMANTGLRTSAAEEKATPLFQSIAHKARSLVSALDEIVWAVDPEANSLQSLADYLSSYTEDYLGQSQIACRFKIPMELPALTVDGRVRHDLFLAVKETLHNTVRHARATEVEFRLRLEGLMLEIDIADNGCGFDPDQNAAADAGHGLKNVPQRLAHIGGSARLVSAPGKGTTTSIRLLLSKTKTEYPC